MFWNLRHQVLISPLCNSSCCLQSEPVVDALIHYIWSLKQSICQRESGAQDNTERKTLRSICLLNPLPDKCMIKRLFIPRQTSPQFRPSAAWQVEGSASSGTSQTDGCRVNTCPYMVHSQLLWRVVFRLQMILRDMARSLPHKSSISVNTSE